MMKTRCLREGANGAIEYTDFGKEVGRDEIHWWVFSKEGDLDSLQARSKAALEAADSLKATANKLKSSRPESYHSLLVALRKFAESHQADTQRILDYLIWLRERDPLAPSIMFTYRVWGSTRRSERLMELNADDVQYESQAVRGALTETALGLRTGSGAYMWNLATFEFVDEITGGDLEYDGEFEIPESEVAARTSWRVFDELATFLIQIRDSLRNILLDIEKCVAWRSLRHSDAFWRRFIAAAIPSEREETQLWDFKETLNIWQTRGDGRAAAKTTFAEDVASFANADGGVLIVGVSDSREIVGVGSVRDLESRLMFAKEVLSERIDYPREIVVFHQVMIPNGSGLEKSCLVIMVARSSEPVNVSDGNGKFTCPIRRETGIARTSWSDIYGAKMHFKSDSYDFIAQLEQFVRDAAA